MGIINPTLITEVEQWKPDTILFFGWAFKSHLKCIRYFYGKIPVFFRGDSTLLAEQIGPKLLFSRPLKSNVIHNRQGFGDKKS